MGFLKNKPENRHKWKNILKSRQFRSSMQLLLICITSLFVFIGFTLSLEKLLGFRESLETEASRAAYSFQEVISSTKNSAVFLGTMPSMELILNHENPTVDQLSRMINDLEPFSSLYHYETIALYYEKPQRIYDSNNGIYHYSDYFAPDFVELLHNMNTDDMWLFHKASTSYYGVSRNMDMLTYIRKLPLYETHRKGYITFSLSLETLQKQIAETLSGSPYPSVVSFEGHLIWCSDPDAMAGWDYTKTTEENTSSLLPGRREYSSVTNSDVQCSFYVTNSQITRMILSDLLPLFLVYLGVLAAAFLLSVFYTLLMLRPVDELMTKIGLTPYTKAASSSPDEYSQLSSALDSISGQLSNINLIMQENKQLIREQLLRGILYDYVDLKQITEEYGANEIIFPYDNYVLILLSLPGLEKIDAYAGQEQIKLVIRNTAVSAFSILGNCYSLYAENRVIAVILNTDHWADLQTQLLNICTRIKNNLKSSVSLYPLFSIVLCSRSAPRLYQAWHLAQRNFIFTSDDADDFVSFSSQEEYTSAIDLELLTSFTQCIINKDSALLKTLGNTFCERYLPEKTDLEEAKRLTRIALCTIVKNLLELNIDVKENLLTESTGKLTNAQSVHECDGIFFGCMSNLIDDEGKISDESHTYIRKAVHYLETHYSEPLTIPQVADYVGVSAIYLNRVFKLSTGKTLSEYLNYYRTTQSLPMLEAGVETIHAISEAMGYNDVRSYIRFFKKFYAMTPNEYRKKYCDM